MAADRDHRSPAPARAAWVALAVTALVIIVYGGYGHHWSWTGINGRTATLWDWLHLLLLPFAAVLLPLWLRHGARLGPALELALAGLGAAFVVVVVAGYTTPWAWTGFTGNSLCDDPHGDRGGGDGCGRGSGAGAEPAQRDSRVRATSRRATPG